MESEPILEPTLTSSADYGIDNPHVQNTEEVEGGGGESNDAVAPIFTTCVPPSRRQCCGLKLSGCQIALIVLAVLVAVMGVAMVAGGYQAFINHELRENMVIRNNSKSFNLWKSTPVPLTLKLYIFNLTNPLEFQHGSAPVLKELGPYVWREYHEKQNISFHPNATVTYLQKRWWVWDQEASGNNTQDDSIVALNTIAITIAYNVGKKKTSQFILDATFKVLKEELFVTTSARELLFDGVEDKILSWVHEKIIPKGSIYHIFYPLIKGTTLEKFDKFAWFYKRNMSVTYDGLFNIMTGEDMLDNMGRIDNWDGKNTTSFYGPPCNSLNGSAGELFSPHITRDTLTFFSSDLCMSAKLFYKKDVTDYDGVTAYRYLGTNHTFANGTTVPGNECFCVSGTCAPMGLLNAESCRMGAPAFVSFPHFYAADPVLLKDIRGLEPPKEDKHGFFLDIVPGVGVPANVTVRLQINLHVTPYHYIGLLEDLPDMYLPMLWFEITGGMTPDLASQMKVLLSILSPMMTVGVWVVLIGLAVLLILVVFASAYWKTKNQSPAGIAASNLNHSLLVSKDVSPFPYRAELRAHMTDLWVEPRPNTLEQQDHGPSTYIQYLFIAR